MPDPIRITAVNRSLADAIGLAQRGDFDKTPACDPALSAMAAEMKMLRRKVTILYAGTTLAAFFILAQEPAASANIEVLGVSVPLSVLSKQALAVFLAGAFTYYAGALMSYSLLYGQVAAILSRIAPEGWQYLFARYDADQLWMNILIPRKLGYPSAVGERRIALLVQASNTAVVLSHIVLVFGAILSAGLTAYDAESVFGIILSVIATIAVLGATVGALCALFLPLTYKPPA
ncbi:MAG TPA: hypothetical protein VJ798_03020 [Rhizomicrobium sp.]|nr:hypothetical protein [Rhizomicrobium sp.]